MTGSQDSMRVIRADRYQDGIGRDQTTAILDGLARNAGAVVMVSALAFMMRSPMLGSLAQIGDQARTHQNNLPFAGVTIQTDHRLEGLRRDIP
jgi:hypothetical protein